MFFRILLVGILIGGILMALSFVSSKASKAPKEAIEVANLDSSRGKFLTSILTLFKFFWYLVLLGVSATLAYFVFKFVGLL